MEKKAIAFREQHGLSHNRSINTHDLLKNLGVITLFHAMSDGVSGMAIKVDEYRFMLVNSSLSVGRQNFTIAHELYHLFVQETFTNEICSTEMFSKKDKNEYLADVFAAHLLIPNDGVMGLIPENELRKDKIKLKTILDIEQCYRCSRRAILFRLEELGIMSSAYKDNFLTDIAKGARDNNYPVELYLPSTNEIHFIGEDYINTIQKLYDSNEIREIDYLVSFNDVGISKF